MSRSLLSRPGTTAGGLAGGAVTQAHDVPILMYHSIAARAAPRFARFVVHPAEFAAQMGYLAAAGYEPMTALDLSRRHADGDLSGRSVVLTFDDAFTDFETAVLPILQQHQFPATLYVPTAYPGRTASWLRDCDEDQRPILSWHALRDIAAAGIEVASHSHTHPQLDRMALAEVRNEVRRSRCLLEDNLGVPVEGFAYPFGYWNGSVRASVSAAGYSYACVVADLPVSATADVWTLPRITAAAGLGVDGFARLLAGSSTPVGRLSSDLKRWAWRAIRRNIRSVGGGPQAVHDHEDAGARGA
jgi:peptidoglycan/xylan/chitin deacetylase (PgdA/CDA1 family)